MSELDNSEETLMNLAEKYNLFNRPTKLQILEAIEINPNLYNWHDVYKIDAKLRKDKDIYKALFAHPESNEDTLQVASSLASEIKELWNDPEFLRSVASKGTNYIREISPILAKEKKFFITLLEKSGDNYYTSDYVRDIDEQKYDCDFEPHILALADETLKKDKEVVWCSVKNSVWGFIEAHEILKKDKQFILSMCERMAYASTDNNSSIKNRWVDSILDEIDSSLYQDKDFIYKCIEYGWDVGLKDINALDNVEFVIKVFRFWRDNKLYGFINLNYEDLNEEMKSNIQIKEIFEQAKK